MSDDSTAGWTPPQQPNRPERRRPVRIRCSRRRSTARPAPAGTGDAIPPPPPARRSAGRPLRRAAATAAAPAGLAAGVAATTGRRRVAGDGPIGERSGSSKKVLIGAVVGVLAIGAAGVFAVTQMTGGNSGGAASPEELGEAFMESLDQEDVLGAIDLLLPGERDTFSEPAPGVGQRAEAVRGALRGRIARRRRPAST